MVEDKKYWDELEWLVDNEINKAYQTRRTKRKRRDWFSASNAGYCKRATILNRLNAKEDEHDDKTKRTFWLGDCIHKAIQELAKKSGQLVAAEEFVAPYGSGDISGAFDIILKTRNKENVLYELKSTGDGIFWKRVLKDKAPAIQHVFQAITYWILNKKYRIDLVKVAYISREGVFIRAFTVHVTDELVQQVKDWWDSLRVFQKNRELPPIYEADTYEYKSWCKNCTFNKHWCFGDPNDIADNLLQLDWGPNEAFQASGKALSEEKKDSPKESQQQVCVEKEKPVQVQVSKPARKSKKNKTTDSDAG